MQKHSCIKCSKSYQDDDVDAYYCPECIEAKKLLAIEIDRKMKDRPSTKPASALQQYDAAPKVRGFMKVSL